MSARKSINKQIIWVDGTVLYLNDDSAGMTLCFCQNCIPKRVNLVVYRFKINKYKDEKEKLLGVSNSLWGGQCL